MSNAIHKLEFLDQFGSVKHKAAIPGKVDHMVKSIPDEVRNVYNDNLHSVIQSKLVKDDSLHHLLNHKESDVRNQAAGNPNIKGDHLDHIIKHGSDGQITQVLHGKNPHLTAKHIHGILDRPVDSRGHHPAGTIAYKLADRMDDSHWAKVASHPSVTMATNAVNSRKMPMKHLLTVATEHPDDHTRRMGREQHFERHANGDK